MSRTDAEASLSAFNAHEQTANSEFATSVRGFRVYTAVPGAKLEEGGLTPALMSANVQHCRGARTSRAEIIPVEPVWVMPAKGAANVVRRPV